jgi:hypothetical protein
MSEVTRAVALAEAIKFYSGQSVGMAAITSAASFFEEFLMGQGVSSPPTDEKGTNASRSTPPVEGPKPVEAKPKKDTAAKAAAKTEAVLAAEMAARVKATEDAAGPSRQEVALSVEKMLKANKRNEAKELLTKHGATSVSSLAETAYAEFIAEAAEILADDMTA